MTQLVTGGAGFIGSHIVERLVRDGKAVAVLDNFSSGKRENLAGLEGRFRLIEGDMADPAVCRKACAGVDVVFHQAAMPSVPKSVEDPVASHRVNVDGTFNVLLAARDAGVRRVVYAASSSAYGETEQLPKIETIIPAPLSPYGVQKLLGEHYCRAFSACYGLSTVSLRYFNVFGPRQDPKSQYAAAIPAFITAILEGRPPMVYGDGEQTRDFTYVDNVVEANLLAAGAENLQGEVVNIAGGRRISVKAAIETVNALLERDIAPIFGPARVGDIKHSWADIRRSQEVLDYRPRIDFEEGLRRTIEWYRRRTERAS